MGKPQLKLTGRVIYPTDPGWNGARRNFNQRFDVEPQAIVFCQSTQDVANAVLYAREHKIPLRVRSGRHNYEGWSLIANGLVIDVSEMDNVSVDREAGLATVGAGMWMLDLSETLGEMGVTFPLATGPTVGISGLTLGGGFGLTSRKFGLTCDNLVEAEVVLADGQIIHCNDRHNRDLFWALKGGGGGNFGIVTNFTFRVHPVKNVMMFQAAWNWEDFEKAVDAWQHWAPSVDDGISSVLALVVDRTVKLYGIYTADDQDLPKISQLLAPLFAAAPPASEPIVQPAPYVIAARLFMEEGDVKVDAINPSWTVHVHADQQIYKATSAVAMQPLPMEAITLLRQYLEQVPPLHAPAEQPSMVQLLAGGGAINRVAPEETAVFYRGAQFVVQYDAFWMAPEDGPATMKWCTDFRNALLPYTLGAYVNYVDADISAYLQAYYGPHVEKLVKIKKKYDPQNVFNFPQSIPVKL